MRKKIYELYDLEGNKIMEGNAIQLSCYVNCEESSIRTASQMKTRLMKKYRVVGTDRREEANKINKTTEREMTPVETMYWALKVYGNTCTVFDPSPYFPDLQEKEGLNCTCREVIEPRRTTVSKGRRPKPEVYWIVEVVNAVRTSPSV